MRRRLVLAGLAAGLALSGPACSGRGGAEGRSALLVTLDTTRQDALGCYGRIRGITPALDALAREGVRYDAAYTVTPITLPAHASMLTGLYPIRHGVRENGLWALPADARTLAEEAREAGFQTAAFLAAVVLDARFGLDQGFDVYDVPEAPAVSNATDPAQRPGHEVVERAKAWLRAREPGRPFFLWVHFFDPHGPWDPPERFRRGPWRDSPYHAEVAAMDDAVGELIAELRETALLERCVVMVVGDHGEGLGQHGEPSHGPFVYDSTLRVPLIVRYPDGYRAGERDPGVVSVVDVFPTLARAMGIADERAALGLDGRSLYRTTVAPGRGVYFETYMGYIAYGWSPLAGWVDAEGKYVHGSEERFYDVRADPGEERDLARERAASLERYRRAIADVAERPRLAPAGGGAEELDPELAAELRALGYAAVGAPRGELPHPLAESTRPSPWSRMEAHRKALFAMELAGRGKLERAARMFEEVLEENPENAFARDRLADALKRLGRHAEAIPHLRRVLEEGPEWSYSVFALGVCYLEIGHREEALAAFRRALALDPDLTRTVEAMLATLLRRGQEEDARFYREGLFDG